MKDRSDERTVTGGGATTAHPPLSSRASALLARGASRFVRSAPGAAGPSVPSPSPEQLLIQRARSGESDAFDALFLRYKDGVYACLWNLLDGDADLVDEAVGSVFLSAYRSLPRFRGDAAFSTWLYRIAINEAHSRQRQKKRWLRFGMLPLPEQASADSDMDGESEGSDSNDPAVRVLRADEDSRLRTAVSALPEPYRTPVVLRYLNGMDSTEIAQVLGRPAGTVRYQVSRALQLLRERLGSEWLS